MGIFDKILKNKNNNTSNINFQWLQLTSLDQLNDLDHQSKPSIIFKHSTRCGISSMVISRFEKMITEEIANNYDIYYLDLLSYRNISDEIAYKYQVRHQSPQVLVIKNGEAITNASHYDISSLIFENYI